jgi:hypothetical protein
MQKNKVNYKHYEFDFTNVLVDDKCHYLLYQHCRNEMNSEMIEFIDTYHYYANNPNHQTMQQAIEIRNEFVALGSRKEINIPATVRKETLERVEKGDYQTAFDLAYISVLQSLKDDVFSRFKRTKKWIQYVESCSDKYLRTIATHISDIHQIIITCDDLTRKIICKKDLDFALHLMQDYYHWKPLYTNIKKNVKAFFTKKNFMDDQATEQFGYMIPYKVSCWLNCSARFAVETLNTKRFFQKVYMHDIELLEYIHDIDLSKFEYPTAVVRQVYKPGGLIRSRQQSSSMTVFYLPDRKLYIQISKSCESNLMPVKEKYYTAHQYVVVLFQELSDNECQFTVISMNSLKGWLKQRGSPNKLSSILLKSLAISFCKDVRKKVKLAISEAQKPSVVISDDIGIMKTLVDYESMIQQQQKLEESETTDVQ